MTSTKNNSKFFFMFSFLPAALYWYLEENYPLKTALLAGIILSIVELIIEKIWTKEIHQLSIINAALIVVFGFISYFINENGTLFKLVPSIMSFVLASSIIYLNKKKSGLFAYLSASSNFTQKLPPHFVLKKIEKDLVYFFIGYGCLMAYFAIFTLTKYWLLFRSIGFYILFFLFMVTEIILLRIQIRRNQ